MIKIPKPKFQVGDRVWANCSELEIAPFEAIVCEVKFDHRRIYSGRDAIEYALLEDEEGKICSDGYTEDMLSRSYPR